MFAPNQDSKYCYIRKVLIVICTVLIREATEYYSTNSELILRLNFSLQLHYLVTPLFRVLIFTHILKVIVKKYVLSFSVIDFRY